MCYTPTRYKVNNRLRPDGKCRPPFKLSTKYIWELSNGINISTSITVQTYLPQDQKSGREIQLCGKSICSWCDGSSDRSFMVDPLSYFLFHPVLHDWFNKGHGMCYPVCGMVHIKEPLLLIRIRSPCGSSRFPFSLSEWSFTRCLTYITINKMC